jgi:hypothetical protein
MMMMMSSSTPVLPPPLGASRFLPLLAFDAKGGVLGLS